MTLTYESGLDRIKANHDTEYQRSLPSRVIVWTCRQTYTVDQLLYTATKVISKNMQARLTDENRL